MPVYIIEQEMPAQELQKWALYLQARPIGWREDNRTSMMLNAQGVKQTGDQIFPTLRALKDAEARQTDEEVMKKSFNKSVFAGLLERAHN